MNRADRRAIKKLTGVMPPPVERENGNVRTDVKYGVCKGCSHRKLLWLPAKLCERDLLNAATASGLIFNPAALGGAMSDGLPAEVPFTAEQRAAALEELDRMEAGL